jgi:hypothetical protein
VISEQGQLHQPTPSYFHPHIMNLPVDDDRSRPSPKSVDTFTRLATNTTRSLLVKDVLPVLHFPHLQEIYTAENPVGRKQPMTCCVRSQCQLCLRPHKLMWARRFSRRVWRDVMSLCPRCNDGLYDPWMEKAQAQCRWGIRPSSADALDHSYPLVITRLNKLRPSTYLRACNDLH